MNSRSKGRAAESVALDFLVAKGFALVEQNYQILAGEVDIVMQQGDEMVFVEVKSLNADAEFSIYETISPTKLHKIEKSIHHWLLGHQMLEAKWRVDFVGIVYDATGEVKHIEHITHL